MLLPHSFRSSIKALSLIELLIALSLAILLVGVVFSIYSLLLNMMHAQNDWRNSISPATSALEILDSDFSGALIPVGLTNSPFLLNTTDKQTITLQFCSAHGKTGVSNSFMAYGISQVQYLLYPTGAKEDDYSLIRKVWPFRPAVYGTAQNKEELVTHVKHLEIQVYDGQNWKTEWGAKTSEGLPKAARIRITINTDNGSKTVESETLIPAGIRILPHRQATGNTD